MSSKDVVMAAAGAAVEPTYIEDVFSTYLYTGTNASQTINNGIDLAGEGGLVWLKGRSIAAGSFLYDTVNGGGKYLSTTSTAALANTGTTVVNFQSTGFQFPNGNVSGENASGYTYASWTFRKAPKFFDVVTYTGNGVDNRQIAHSLGISPGMVIVKATSTTSPWFTWQRTFSGTVYNAYLNATGEVGAYGDFSWNNAGVMSESSFCVSGTNGSANINGVTYVAYLFAHDTDTDGLIQCGGYTGTGSSAAINLGWEPQYVLVKQTNAADDWFVFDSMRGMAVLTGGAAGLFPNKSNAEVAGYTLSPTSTGFMTGDFRTNGATYIYMAIRRGPMRTPTDGTTVFTPSVYAGSSSPTGTVISSGFPVDLYINKLKSGDQRTCWVDRLRGDDPALFSQLTQAEESYTNIWPYLDEQLGIRLAAGQHDAGQTFSNLSFRRAPGFFDVVCYTGTGSARTVNHNLGVAPELMIVKRRDAIGSWFVYAAPRGADEYGLVNFSDAFFTPASLQWNSTAPTSTVFTVGTSTGVNASAGTYVAYLFASCPGVSKVGSYTGTGAAQNINCGFTTGSRFVLIKRTDSTGDWFVWDSARGITSGNDPYLLLNSTAAEVTNTNYVDQISTGFTITSSAPAAINASGGSYIFLAVA